MGRIGIPELLIILAIIILIFGASRLPQLGKGLGEGIRSFKKSFSGEDDEKPASSGGTQPTDPARKA